ncbi:DUF4276 family protein [Arachnia propionica]|uniref:DUF4276 family protein n=1 Tax=Arachnia propionica TaxID=1750 RepID=A0A3P1WRC5_9ACTN|nr:DUF4276 family protein [Arachnia propionica]RRD48388.1 DUF4276 family protein [Arachnia propionica]
MRLIALLVEGHTEERVVDQVLAPAARKHDIVLQPIVVCTSAGHHGGGSWRNYHDKLQVLLKQQHLDTVGILIDLYGYPSGAPGRSPSSTSDREALMQALVDKYDKHDSPRFRPCIVLHEVEAWVLAAIDAGGADKDLEPRQVARVRRAIEEAGGAEAVNSQPDLAPSKRLTRIVPGYLKVVNGPRWIAAAGLGAVLERCPVFKAWWEELLIV